MLIKINKIQLFLMIVACLWLAIPGLVLAQGAAGEPGTDEAMPAEEETIIDPEAPTEESMMEEDAGGMMEPGAAGDMQMSMTGAMETPGESPMGMMQETPPPLAPKPTQAPPAPFLSVEYFEQLPVLELFQKGGPVMYPLLLLSIVGLAFIIERFIHFHKAKIDTDTFLTEIKTILRDGKLGKAVELCNNTKGPIASIMKAGLVKFERGKEEVERAIEAAGGLEMARLERGLIVLASVSNIAPLLGFLGTVTGMIASFDAIAKAGLSNPGLVAGGISEALITTATGLTIAIPVQAAYNYFTSQLGKMVLEMEESSGVLVEHIK